MRKTLLRLAPLVLLGGCTWGIDPAPGSNHIRTVWSGDVHGCRDLGKITVSVMGRVGPFKRNDIKVRDELQVQARNSALEMHADTIKPLGEPVNGSQAWEAYACAVQRDSPSHAPPPTPLKANPSPAQPSGGFQAYPAYPAKGG